MQETVKERVKNLKEKGLSFTEIGKIIGMTRQRAHQIYHDKQH